MSRRAVDPSLNNINAALLTDAQIAGLGVAECSALIEQLDQQLVNSLQETDANFLRATRAVTDKILPAVEKYGESSREIWQSVKLWKAFFEAAAGIRLAEPRWEADAEEAGNETQASEARYQDMSDVTLQAGEQSHRSDADSSVSSTPSTSRGTPPRSAAKAPTWSDDASPFDLLQQDMESEFGVNSTINSPARDSRQGSRLRDLSMDSPDIVRPELETLSLGDMSKGKGREETPDDSPIRPARKSNGLADKATAAARKSSSNTMLLQKVLQRNATHGPTASTPATNRTQKHPFSIPQDWDGLADLSHTSLDPYHQSPNFPNLPRARSLDDSDAAIAFPSMTHFSVNRAGLSKTPAKEAARMVTRDVLETAAIQMGGGGIDSPVIEPPSVMKNWATRGYGGLDQESPIKPPAQPNFAPKIGSSKFSDPPAHPVFPPKAAGASRVSDLIRLEDTNEFVEEENLAGQESFDDFGEEAEGDGQDAWGASFGEEGESGMEDTLRQDEEDASASFDMQPPEDTLFGAKRPSNGIGQLEKFLRGDREDMQTLHGGQLLESQPFDRSPLAGRDVKHGL